MKDAVFWNNCPSTQFVTLTVLFHRLGIFVFPLLKNYFSSISFVSLKKKQTHNSNSYYMSGNIGNMLEISQKIKVQYWIMALYVFVAKSLYKLIQIASGGSCRLHRPTITSKCCSPYYEMCRFLQNAAEDWTKVIFFINWFCAEHSHCQLYFQWIVEQYHFNWPYQVIWECMSFPLFDLLGSEILLETKASPSELNTIKTRTNFNLVFCVFLHLKMADVLTFNTQWLLLWCDWLVCFVWVWLHSIHWIALWICTSCLFYHPTWHMDQ